MTTVLDQLDPGMLAAGDVAVSLDGDVLLIELNRPRRRSRGGARFARSPSPR